MSEPGSAVGEKLGDADFLKTFYSNFDMLDEGGKEVAVRATKALIEKKRKRKNVSAEFVATFYPDFEKLDEGKKVVAIEVSKALIEKMRKERVRIT